MPRGIGNKNLNNDKKTEILIRHLNGESLRNIALAMNIPKSTVSDAFKRCQHRNTVESPKHGGQNKISTAAQDAALVALSDAKRLATQKVIQHDWRIQCNVQASISTLYSLK